MRMTLAEIQAACHAQMLGESLTPLTGLATDNRLVQKGDLFVCIAGEKVDGHNFASAAIAAGAAAVLCQRDSALSAQQLTVPLLLVDNTVLALGQIAHEWRSRSRATVVGVTGSAGKTTVKEVLAQVLSVHGKTACNVMNLNTQIGLPTSLLRTSGDEQFLVMEVGISQAHDMDELGAILTPDMALILNVANAHTEGLGEKGVAWHKSRLLHYLKPQGQALVCADYDDLVREARQAHKHVQFFSASGKPVRYRAAYKGLVHGADGQEKGAFRLWLDGTSIDVETPFCGSYGTENTIAIAAIAHLLGLSRAEIIQGFAQAHLPDQRFQVRTIGAWCSINDTYNANPLSMKRMLEAAAERAGNQSLLCLLGSMGELGSEAPHEHQALGEFLAELRPKAIFWYGPHFDELCLGLKMHNYQGPCIAVHNPQEFLDHMQAYTAGGGVLLFKGSRVNGLERYCQAFEDQQEKSCAV